MRGIESSDKWSKLMVLLYCCLDSAMFDCYFILEFNLGDLLLFVSPCRLLCDLVAVLRVSDVLVDLAEAVAPLFAERDSPFRSIREDSK